MDADKLEEKMAKAEECVVWTIIGAAISFLGGLFVLAKIFKR